MVVLKVIDISLKMCLQGRSFNTCWYIYVISHVILLPAEKQTGKKFLTNLWVVICINLPYSCHIFHGFVSDVVVPYF